MFLHLLWILITAWTRIFLLVQSYSSVDTLLSQSRLTILRSVQALTEIQDFLLFIKGDGVLMLSLNLK